MEDENYKKQFKIEKSTNSNSHMMNNEINIKTEDNIIINKEDEDISLSILPEKHNNNLKPSLTKDEVNTPVQKPKLVVPMDGLDLLSNPKKTYESSANNTDTDKDIGNLSDSSSDGNNYSNNYSNNSNSNLNNLFKNDNTIPSDDGQDSHDSEYNSDNYNNYNHTQSNKNYGEDNLSISSFSDKEEIKPQKTYEELQREKQFLLFKLERLEKSMKVKLSRRFTMASNIDDINYEYEKLKKQRDVDKSVKFQRKALMAITSGMEFLNNKFDPIDAKLDGWSESVMENIDDYDEVFEELHDKYAEKIEVAPELKLLMMVGGSAFMFHLTNTLFKSNVPSLNEILKQNPDIMRNISEAAVNNMNNNMGGDEDFANMMKQSVNMKAQQYGGSNMGGNMRGPTNVDDLISDASGDESMHNVSYNPRKQRRSRKSNKGINIDI